MKLNCLPFLLFTINISLPSNHVTTKTIAVVTAFSTSPINTNASVNKKNKSVKDSSIVIVPPKTNQDYKDLASLLVQTFEQPSQTTKSSITQASSVQSFFTSSIEQFKWKVYDKNIAEKSTYRRYIQTAEQMMKRCNNNNSKRKGSATTNGSGGSGDLKYAVFLAKLKQKDGDDIQSSSSNSSSSNLGGGEVVGMVEMGMTLLGPQNDDEKENNGIEDDGITNRNYPKNDIIDPPEAGIIIDTATTATATSTNSTDDPNTQTQKTQNNKKARATIGVLCIKPTHQSKGIGQELLQHSEHMIRTVWNEECVSVDVEPGNAKAVDFFVRFGFIPELTNSDDEDIIEEGCESIISSTKGASEYVQDDLGIDNENQKNSSSLPSETPLPSPSLWKLKYTTVLEKGKLEQRPHYVLTKVLCSKSKEA